MLNLTRYVYESILEDKSLRVPESISHVRSLHKFSPDIRRLIWRQICESGTPITEDNVVAMTIKYGIIRIVNSFNPSIETGFAFSNLRHEIYSPKVIISAAKQVINQAQFDLDPASCKMANELHVGKIASKFFDEQSDGSTKMWHGHVWLFPPGASDHSRQSSYQSWFNLAESKFTSGEIVSCQILLRANLSNSWFTRIFKYPHCILSDKISFQTPMGRDRSLLDSSYVVVYM